MIFAVICLLLVVIIPKVIQTDYKKNYAKYVKQLYIKEKCEEAMEKDSIEQEMELE